MWNGNVSITYFSGICARCNLILLELSFLSLNSSSMMYLSSLTCEKSPCRATSKYRSQFVINPLRRINFNISISFSSIVILQHLIVYRQIRVISKTSLIVGLPVLKLLIYFHQGDFIITVTYMQYGDTLDSLYISNTIFQGTSYGFNEQGQGDLLIQTEHLPDKPVFLCAFRFESKTQIRSE